RPQRMPSCYPNVAKSAIPVWTIPGNSLRMPGMERHTADGSFGRKLRELRDARGWSQQELADRAGVHRRAVGQVERSESGGHFETVIALAEALGVKVEVFVPKRRAAKRKKG